MGWAARANPERAQHLMARRDSAQIRALLYALRRKIANGEPPTPAEAAVVARLSPEARRFIGVQA
jgi:hypothetical protein